VPATEIDAVYLDASYYVRPDAVRQRPYTLLFETLRRTGYVGIAQWTHHNREHIVVLRAGPFGLVLHTMYYREEIRSMDDFHTDTPQGGEAECGLTKMLVEGLAASFVASEYTDHYRENLQALIARKMAGQDADGRRASPALAPVVDVAALKAGFRFHSSTRRPGTRLLRGTRRVPGHAHLQVAPTSRANEDLKQFRTDSNNILGTISALSHGLTYPRSTGLE
jgi:DNA end-binding protein Ku